MRLLADPCCLLLIAVGVIALIVKLIQWLK